MAAEKPTDLSDIVKDIFTKFKYGTCDGHCGKVFEIGDFVTCFSRPWKNSALNQQFCIACTPPLELKKHFQFMERHIDESDENDLEILNNTIIFNCKYPEWGMPASRVLIKLRTEKPLKILGETLRFNLIDMECYNDAINAQPI